MPKRSSQRRFNEYLQEVAARSNDRNSRQATASISVHPGHDHQSDLSRDPPWERSNRNFSELFLAYWRLITPFRGLVGISLMTVTCSTLLGLLPPLATKLAIDSALSDPPIPPPAPLNRILADWSPMKLLYAIAIITTLLAFLRTLIHLSGRWQLTKAVNLYSTRLRRAVFSHVLELPLDRLHAMRSGGVTSMLREDVGSVADLLFSMIYNPWQAIVQLTGSLIILAIVDWRLLIAGVLLLPIVYWSHRWYIYSIRPLYRDVRKQRQEVDASTTESFSGIRIVRTFARQHAETKRFIAGQHLLTRQTLMVWWRTRLIEVVWEVIIPLASTVLLLYGGWQILNHRLTLGDLMMFLVYLTMLLGPVATLAGSATAFQNGLAGLDRVLDVLAMERELQDLPGAIEIDRHSLHGKLQFKNVGFKYPSASSHVLRSIDAQVEPNQTIALVGRSGAGKTTLCNLIARFYDPVEGSILLDGLDLRSIRLQSYRRLLGIVEQDVFLFDGTIAENIAFSRRDASMQEIQIAAQSAAAAEFIDRTPKGYESVIGERGVKLSGGQRQRIAIARAVLSDPKILILDEATSNLDSESEQAIQRSLQALRKNRTTFVIAHRLSTIISADQIWVMENGEIIERGTHDSLLRNNGRYAEMVRLQLTDLHLQVK